MCEYSSPIRSYRQKNVFRTAWVFRRSVFPPKRLRSACGYILRIGGLFRSENEKRQKHIGPFHPAEVVPDDPGGPGIHRGDVRHGRRRHERALFSTGLCSGRIRLFQGSKGRCFPFAQIRPHGQRGRLRCVSGTYGASPEHKGGPPGAGEIASGRRNRIQGVQSWRGLSRGNRGNDFSFPDVSGFQLRSQGAVALGGGGRPECRNR